MKFDDLVHLYKDSMKLHHFISNLAIYCCINDHILTDADQYFLQNNIKYKNILNINKSN